jgi:hypothetical protein
MVPAMRTSVTVDPEINEKSMTFERRAAPWADFARFPELRWKPVSGWLSPDRCQYGPPNFL